MLLYQPYPQIEDLEAFEELRSRASGKLGALPPELVTKHVLKVTKGADWPVQRAALDAMIRRLAATRRDALRLTARPRNRSGLGLYATGRRGGGRRPYRTLLAALDPLIGSCDCKDFQKGALGICKHLLVAVEDLAAKPKKWQRAAKLGADLARRDARLVWDPVRPLRGAGDWLNGIGWIPGIARDGRKARRPRIVLDHFAGDEGRSVWRLQGPAPLDPAERLDLVDRLLRSVQRRKPGSTGMVDDPALIPLLGTEKRRLRRRLAGAALGTELAPALKTMERPLYPYQQEGAAKFVESGRLLLADDMGLGKTAQAIGASHLLWHSGELDRALIIVPATLKAQWIREWKLFTDAPIRVVDGNPEERAAIYRETRRGFLVANYEQVLRDLQLMLDWGPDMVVLDEAQRIKNWETKTASYVKQLQPKYRLVLTGTPMENRLSELASVMDWVDERAIEPKWRLTPWHATLCDGKQEVAGARNLDTLRERLANTMLRRLRRDVLDQLPPRTDSRLPVDLTPAQRMEHDDLSQPIAAIMRRAETRPLTRAEFLRLMQLLTTQRMICNGLAQLRFEEDWPTLRRMECPQDATIAGLDSPKLLEIRELIRQLVLNGNQKVVVFSQWRRMLLLASWAVSGLLRDAGLRSAFFSGDESQKRRTQNIVEFHDDPSLAVLFSTDAGGVGLNLQRAASSVVNLELPWNPAVLEQRIGRIYRLGQKEPVQVFNLVSEQGIEARIASIVSDKQALFSGLFDGKSNELRFTGSGRFLDRVEKLVEPVPAAIVAFEEPEDPLDPVVSPAAESRPPMDERYAGEYSAAPMAAESGSSARPKSESRAATGPASPSAPETSPAPRPSSPGPATVDGAQVRELLSGIRVERTEVGGIRIEAAPESAGALAAMFQGMADLLAGAAAPGAGGSG